MTCEHCCGANDFFSSKEALKQMKKYRKKGAVGVTQKLISLMSTEIQAATLLDVGGGIGAVQWHFLKNNASSTLDVDASDGFLQAAKEYASINNWSEKSAFLKGDFVELSSEIEMFDYVVMDKVVCCYPDFEELITIATSKCKKEFALTYPLGGFIPRIITEIAALYQKVKKSPFRSYIHSPAKIHMTIIRSGFELKESKMSFPWYAKVYQRIP